MILSSLLILATPPSTVWDGGVRVRLHELRHQDEWHRSPQMQSRLGLLWGKSQAFGGRLVLQDSRQLSEMTNSQAGNLMLHQGYVSSRVHKGIQFDAGRRELHLGLGRLVSSAPWSDNGRAFDGVFLSVKGHNYPINLTAWATQPGTPGSQGKRFAGLYLSKTFSPSVHLETWWMRKQKLSNQSDRHTLGGAARLKSSTFNLDAEGSYQFGQQTDHSIAAWGGSVQAQWQARRYRYQPRLGAELNLASGDSDNTDRTDQTFDSLYGSRHQYWGHLDLIGGRNAMDIHLWAGAMLAKTKLSIHGHLLSLQSNADDFYFSNGAGRALDSSQANGSDIGTEIDVVATKTYGRFGVELGLSVFLPGTIGKISDLGDEPIVGGYLQLKSRFN